MSMATTTGSGPPVVVAGAGLAGLTAAIRLAAEGRSVLVLARGLGAVPLGAGTLDVLGYGPEPVASPALAWDGFVASHPDHPYAQLPLGVVEEAVSWFKAQVDEPRYVGDLNTNFLLPTAAGAAKPSAVVPQTMAAGDLRRQGSAVIVGLRQFRDLHAGMVAANLRHAGFPARSLEIDLPGTAESEVGSLRLARRFEEPLFRAAVASLVLRRLGDSDDRVAFPAVLGAARAELAWEEMEARLERPVFEIPTPPPSVPGSRLLEALRFRLRALGGRTVIGAEVVGVDASGPQVQAVHAVGGGRRRRVAASAVVLATGGWASGAIEVDSRGGVRETALDLPLHGVPADGEARFLPGRLDPHPLLRAGIAVDGLMRPVDGEGQVVFENVHAAGALLAGAAPAREKSGEGLAIATAYRAAGAVLEREK